MKEHKCPLIDESKRKKWYTQTHTLDFYSAIRKNAILSLLTTWRDLDSITPSETRHTEKYKYHTALFLSGTSEIK